MDLAFAIDDLYSTGWWPEDGVSCVCGQDGRWFPEPSAVAGLFAGAGRSLEMCVGDSGSACRARWTDSRGGAHTVVARDEAVAGVMALAALRRSAGAGRSQIHRR